MCDGFGGLTVSGVKGFPDNREKCRYPCSYSSVHKIHNRILESIYIYNMYRKHVSLYIYMLTPPMIHRSLLFVSSGSWEVGNLRCEDMDRDQISPKFLKLEMRKHWQGSNFSKSKNLQVTLNPKPLTLNPKP